jgi:hypothetical protein
MMSGLLALAHLLTNPAGKNHGDRWKTREGDQTGARLTEKGGRSARPRLAGHLAERLTGQQKFQSTAILCVSLSYLLLLRGMFSRISFLTAHFVTVSLLLFLLNLPFSHERSNLMNFFSILLKWKKRLTNKRPTMHTMIPLRQ